MGGGDLNLKKSWHPSTLKNQEKVWKAEQKNDLEKKRIVELQREIVQERAREDMQKFAEDKGVVEKKDSMKLDWMYKGPGGMVNREEYLLGRSVDKTFELAQQAEKASTSTFTRKNHVDHECLPPSIFSGGNEQVDMARKLQEDPLYAIKKKEMENRSQLLKNPVRLKQLRELMEIEKQKEKKEKKEKKHKKDKKRKKSKKKSKRHADSSDSEDLDALLCAKLNKWKEKLNKAELSKLNQEESDSDEKTKYDDGKTKCGDEKTRYDDEKTKYDDGKTKYDDGKTKCGDVKTRYDDGKTKYNDGKTKYGDEKTRYGDEKTKIRVENTKFIDEKTKHSGGKTEKHSNHKKRRNSSSEGSSSDEMSKKKKPYGLQLSSQSKTYPSISRVPHPGDGGRESKQNVPQDRTTNRWIKSERKKLSAEEIEQRRQEMMDNVKWRDSERERNVSRYRQEEKEETKESKSYNKDFLRKQLSYAASQGTVEGRIKANINNIQRSGMAMDKNFARR